jgi:hypothetical protein
MGFQGLLPIKIGGVNRNKSEQTGASGESVPELSRNEFGECLFVLPKLSGAKIALCVCTFCRPRRWIANARNAAVEAALALDPDVIAFANYESEPSCYFGLKTPLKQLIQSGSENGVREFSRTPHARRLSLCVRPLTPRLSVNRL